MDDSIDFYGEGESYEALGSDTEGTFDNYDHSEHPPIQPSDLAAFQPSELQSMQQQQPPGQLQPFHPPVPTAHTWVDTQPGIVWYKFNEGSITVVLKTSDPIIIENQWCDLTINLAYRDSADVVQPEKPNSSTFREVSCSIEGDNITLLLKPKVISRNHQSKLFCFSFSLGDTSIRTTGFEVRTKRTKRKRSVVARRSRPSENDYKRQAREVIERLQWSISGYSSACEGFVDFTRPIYSCTLCSGQKQHGHLPGCSILALL